MSFILHQFYRHIFFSVVFLISGMGIAYAQGAKFSVNSTIGCTPFTVVVTDLSGVSSSTAVNYDYGVGEGEDALENHTYTIPGVYRIIQTVANANPRQDTIFIEVINQYPPEFLLFNCKGNLGSVFIQDTLYQAYEIDWGDGNSETANAYTLVGHNFGVVGAFDVTVKGLINGAQTAADNANTSCSSTTKRLNMIPDILPATIHQMQVLNTDVSVGSISIDYTLEPNNNYLIEVRSQNQPAYTIVDTINQVLNPTSYVLENLNTQDNFYCVSITAFDPCDGDRKRSNIGCSINLKVFPENNQNRINWRTSSTDFLNYALDKNGSSLINISDQSQSQHIDNQVVCGLEYEYQLHLTEVKGFMSISDVIKVSAISSDIPDPVQNISASVVGQDVDLVWEEPVNFLAETYIVSKSVGGSVYSVLDSVPLPAYSDEGLFTQSTRYYYEVSYFDACQNMSYKSIIASPILLEVNFDKSLSWSAYEGWENGVSEYVLEKYDEQGQLIETLSMGTAQSYREDPATNNYQYILYKVKAIANNPTLGEVESNVLKVIYPSKVVFPNAFSPNGDGQNDTFIFKSRYITNAQMNIFNRWGELVFHSNSVDVGWDGNVNGRPAPAGVYIHHTQMTDDMGITFTKSGEVLLIR